MHPPGFEMAHTHVYDPLDPDVFWETLGGHHWPCRVSWDRRCDSPYLQRADDKNVALVMFLRN